MVQILVQLPESMAQQLEQVAPASSRQRSRFIRLAIQKAIMELQEDQTREAYRRHAEGETYFNPEVWETPPVKRPSVKRKRRSAK